MTRKGEPLHRSGLRATGAPSRHFSSSPGAGRLRQKTDQQLLGKIVMSRLKCATSTGREKRGKQGREAAVAL
jgi:hypothetical protein